MRYKVMMGYTEYVPIDETELEKALMAFASGSGAIFKHGAVGSITGVLPDYHAMMGWNPGYKLQPEDWQEIRSNEDCTSANRLLESTRNVLAGKSQERIGSKEARQLAEGMKA